MDLTDRIKDLSEQTREERTYFYVTSVLKEAIKEIKYLREMVVALKKIIANYEKEGE